MRNILIKNKTLNIQKQNNWFRRYNLYYAIGFSFAGGFFLFTAYHFYSAQFNKIEHEQLITITDAVSNKPQIKKSSKNINSIIINLRSYPSYDFHISGNQFLSTYVSDYIKTVKIDDSIQLDLTKEEYQTKILAKTESSMSSIAEKSLTLTVYGLRDKNRSYLNLIDYNKRNKNDAQNAFYIFGILGIIITGLGLFLFTKS